MFSVRCRRALEVRDYVLSFCSMLILSGDLSQWGWDDKEDGMGSTCRPLGVEVYQLDSKVLEGWKAPESPPYKGMHGLKMPSREADGYVGL